MKIVFEDARLLALDKPAGQLVIPGRDGRREGTLQAESEARSGAKVFVVHRIDGEASGLVLFAKDAEAHRALCAQFARRQVRKLYRALVLGALAEDLLIKAPIKEFGSGRMGVHPEGKPAQTTLRVLARYKAATLLEAEPHTGRRHQLRVHLYHAGHPILGDALYGKERPVGGAPRLMLHAFKAQFLHPDGKPMTLEAPPGTDFEEALREAAEG
ncbi:MAG TPA: RluA family pseudouridine synthase [Elusimicrobia bacterium]|nr:RluA family pseudouridine synthase [Elusimicrobiota bacterium]